VVFGEWSLATQFHASDSFLKKFADAQKHAYSKGAGWIFWNFKIEKSGKEGGMARQWYVTLVASEYTVLIFATGLISRVSNVVTLPKTHHSFTILSSATHIAGRFYFLCLFINIPPPPPHHLHHQPYLFLTLALYCF
jgi:hypothetical protein